MFDYRGTAIDTSASRFWTTEYLGSFREAARARRPLGTYMTDALYAVLDAYHSTIQGGVAAGWGLRSRGWRPVCWSGERLR